ncbi:thiamine phosphate synthase [Candidatus Pelagibacter bacterium]|nr:thiamine phosphate synthase [Candidatus Pelagibacter bacterium]|tara:strand:+ start:3776 stop:4342 length:567 start_codon:yes stop_codon:yes gene_type:complete
MHFALPKIFYFINEYDKNYIRKLDKKIAIIYRNYKKKDISTDILKIKSCCKRDDRKFYLSNNIDLAIKLKLDGAYIPSFNQKHIKKKIKNDFLLLGSAHNIKQIKIKEKQNVELIFLSPIFSTKNKNKKLGINKFNLLANHTKKKVIALGGINANNINKLNLTNSYGFASISLIRDNYNLVKSIIKKF